MLFYKTQTVYPFIYSIYSSNNFFLFFIEIILQMSSAGRFLKALNSTRLATRTMYENPYINRFNAKRKVSPDFPKKVTIFLKELSGTQWK